MGDLLDEAVVARGDGELVLVERAAGDAGGVVDRVVLATGRPLLDGELVDL